MIRKFSLFTLLISLALSACQSPVVPTSTPTPTHTITPSQTATLPAPTVTPQPEPTDSQIVIAESDYLLSGSLEVGYANAMVWSAASDHLAVLAQNEVTIVSVPELERVSYFAVQDPNLILDVSPDTQTVAISEGFENILLVDLMSGETICTIAEGRFMGASFSVDGLQLAVASGEEWLVNIYAVYNCSLTQTLTGFETAAPVYDVSYSPDGSQAVWIARATLQLSDLGSGTLSPEFNHMDFINSWALASGRDLLVTATYGEVAGVFQPIIYLWNTVTGENNLKLTPGEIINGLDLDASGYLLAAGAPGHVLIYDLADASQIASLPLSGAETVTDLAFAPDGKTLAVLFPTETGTILTLWGIP